MLRIVKRLSAGPVTAAIAFLLIQIVGALYLPYVTADIVNKGVITGDTSYIWSKDFLMIVLSVCSLLGALLNTYFFSKISYKLGSELRVDIYRKVLSESII